MAEWLPLFPLGQPLFPGLKLDLQIFEQRYINLVKSTLREEATFGICAISEGSEAGVAQSIYPVGVEVQIVDWRQLPNGLLGITVEGGRRFQFDSAETDAEGLNSAQVEFLDDETDEDIPEWCSGLAAIYDEMRNHPEISKRLPALESVKSSGLGNGLAQILPMSMDERIHILEMSDPLRRLEHLINHIETLSQQQQ